MTISTLAGMTPNMRLIDVNGAPHVLTEYQVKMMITIGWTTFLAAWLMNLLNYKVHPSSVNSSPKEKMFIYIFGKKYNILCTFCRSRCCTKGEFTLFFLSCTSFSQSLGNKEDSDLGEDMALEGDGLTDA